MSLIENHLALSRDEGSARVLRRPTPHRTPDILDCLSQLSNDEVPTPPRIANEMLDLLPEHVWSDPTLRFLDPACKSGVFLREIVKRLLVGLADWEPDFELRREHIFKHMVFGFAITEMTGLLSRRTLYYSRDASGPHSVIPFASPDGNLPHVPAEHSFGKSGSCTICGAPASLEREGRENYAYSFIHGQFPEGMNMQFDVIVGNPPYQIGSDGGTRTMPLYQLFIDAAIALNPRYVTMITPSRWFSGGLGLDDFRARMIEDRRLRAIVDHPVGSDCFPGVEIKGGVSYLLWDRDHDGDCEFTTRVSGAPVTSVVRDLRDGDGVLIRDNTASRIVSKVKANSGASCEGLVVGRIPFGASLTTNYSKSASVSFIGAIPLIMGGRIGYVRSDQIERRHDMVGKYKVLLPKASDGAGGESLTVLGEPIALAPGSVCTDTYLLAGFFDTAGEAENYAHYLATKFVRFLVLQRKTTQDVKQDRFKFVPRLDMTRRWNDEDLYEHFGLDADERAYIERAIRPRDVNLSLDSPIPASHLPGGRKYKPGKIDDVEVAA